MNTQFVIEYGKGICRCTEIVDLAIEFDIFHKAGSWFKYNDENICQGRDKLIQFFEDNPEWAEEIEAQVKDRLNKTVEDE